MERMNVKIGGKTYGIFIFCIYSNHWSGEYPKVCVNLQTDVR